MLIVVRAMHQMSKHLAASGRLVSAATSESRVPVEVKSSGKGAMHSMRAFLREKHRPWGIRVSTENFAACDDVLIVPLYAANEINRIVRTLVETNAPA